MKFIADMYKGSETFRQFTEFPGTSSKEFEALKTSLTQAGQFHDLTFKFLEVLMDNKRFKFIKKVADKYMKLYQQFNKEQKITIISATELGQSEKDEVLSALSENPQNQGVQFSLDFRVDPTIIGGLQMYTESEFMDMSVSSRLEKLSTEIHKLVR